MSSGGDGLTTVAAVLVAGGSGSRLGAEVLKQVVFDDNLHGALAELDTVLGRVLVDAV